MSTLINDEPEGRICAEILEELRRSRERHPHYPGQPIRRAAIILEEALEALSEMSKRAEHLARAALQVERVGEHERYLSVADLRKELIQTASTCVNNLVALEQDNNLTPREFAERFGVLGAPGVKETQS